MSLREAYTAHGINHVSVSSLNAYASEPALWVMERLLGKWTPSSPAAARGTATEHGVRLGLRYPDHPVDQCQAIALQHYDGLVAPLLTAAKPKEVAQLRQKIEEQRLAVPGCVAVALAELRQYGIPDEVQARVDHELDRDLPPLLGYADFGWSRHGIVVDLKTEIRLSGDIKPPHARQVAAYLHNTNREGRLCYVTPKRCGVYILEDAERWFDELRVIAIRLGKFLSISRDPQELASFLVPHVEDFRWSSLAAQEARMEVYGL